ncbi:DUF6941 family protein [Pseudomonas aeruginosa]|uniref:DUF6941 family protein n=1 Tax=Pseudomonas aeruginosa TaxID=287 RepID=UPI0018C54A97|nr:hypothetical protein [Pseudomonas aeruginosa]MBG4412520.1 hypothetical protein [Pseudomonas aeruginosa]MBH4534218.1 hypothetical protein [Pseudomonas aeruginosa]MBI8278374.1 hypothetical protein [Pseudomonas aeruginosa]MCL8035337.1 hypothetical protein [Pseudomonas aeruginosa]HEJ2021049.1 hypothetical protein [Pseudomonas aeruginosa]
MSRFVYATYCDDVRLEINGKTSLIGVYADAMFVQRFPTNLMKLCVVVNALTPPDRPFNGFKLSALFNSKAIAEMEVPLAQLQEEATKNPAMTSKNVQAQMIFAPLAIDQPGEMKILFTSDGETFESNALQIMVAPEGAPIIFT